ncbi:MAG: hypothetical protein IKN59_01015 [Paludibacteraceae bacterium]|nr:hypothetical protein [Paludibacteraceae bacterium]
MKKFFSCIVALFAAVSLYAADLNIYASGLKATQAEGVTTVEYVLNAPATAVTVYLYPAEGDAIALPLTDAALLTKGAHQAQLNLAGVANGTYTWAIKAEAAAHDTLQMAPLDGNSNYAFFGPRGVAVDNSPASPYFGRLYVSNAYEGVTGGRMTGQGMYIFDAELNPIGDSCFVGGVNWTAHNETSATANSDWGPYRIAIDEDGYVFVCDNGVSNGPKTNVYMMDPANPAQNFVMVLDSSLRGDGGLYHRINSIAVSGRGANRVLYACDWTDSIISYPIGNTFPCSVKGATAVPALASVNILNGQNTIARDKDGGFWVCQFRGQLDVNPELVHFNAAGQADYIISSESHADMGIANTYRAAMGLNANSTKVALAGGGTFQVYNIGQDSGSALELSKVVVTYPTNLGSRVDGICFDVADNVYVVSASTERLRAYALPKTDNSYTTPAPAASTIVVAGTPQVDLFNFAGTNVAIAKNTRTSCTGGSIYCGADKWEKKKVNEYLTDSIMGYKLDGDPSASGTKYMLCRLDAPLAAGQVVVITGFATSDAKANQGFALYTDRAGSAVIGSVEVRTKKNIINGLMIDIPAQYVGLDSFYIARINGGSSTYLCGVKVVEKPALDTYQIKHPWGTGQDADWSFKGFTIDNGDGTFSMKDLYGGTGFDVAPAVNGTSWIAEPTLENSPLVGDSVLITLNPFAPTVAGILTVTNLHITYSIKHPWGTGQDADWSFKTLTENVDGTWSIRDLYGGTGCNVNPAILGKTWIASPTLVGAPAVGDSCVFVVNPAATTEAEIITITKIGEPTPPQPADTLRLYEIGNNQGWDPTAAIEMTATADSIFEGDFAFTADTTWFAFITVKPETADWNLVNANRYGGANNNELVLNGTYNLAKGEYGFKANSGEYHIVVNIPAMTMTIQKKTSEGLNDMKADDQVMKIYENGQIYIIRNGVRYTAAGAKVE